MHTFHVEDRKAVNDRHSMTGNRWFVMRDENRLAVRMAAIAKFRGSWSVFGVIDYTLPRWEPDSIGGLTFREANTIARLFVRTGTLYRSAPRRESAADRNDSRRPLLVAFGFVTR